VKAVLVWPLLHHAALVRGRPASVRLTLDELVAEALPEVPDVLARLPGSPKAAGPPTGWAVVPGSAVNLSHEIEALRCVVEVMA
jgi:hypothetical protein